MPNLSYRINQALGRLLTGSGLIWLLLVILIGLSIHVVLRPEDTHFSLDQAEFHQSILDLEGLVLFSKGDNLLLLRGSQLWWQSREKSSMISDRFINVLYTQEDLWVKTEASLGILDMNTGKLTKKEVFRDQRFPMAQLVSVDSRGWHLYQQGQVIIYDRDQTSAFYQQAGNHTSGWVSNDWQKGVLFYHRNGWNMYQNYSHKASFNGIKNNVLAEAVISPDLRTVLYVIALEEESQLWAASPDGQGAVLITAIPAQFSSLEASWAPSGRHVALALVGYTGKQEEEVFHGKTLIFEPDSGVSLVLAELSAFAMTLPIPSAWAENGRTIYCYRPDQEHKQPLAFHLVHK